MRRRGPDRPIPRALGAFDGLAKPGRVPGEGAGNARYLHDACGVGMVEGKAGKEKLGWCDY